MIYVRIRGASRKMKGPVTPIENRQTFIRFRHERAAEKFFEEFGFEKRTHSDGTVFVGRNFAMNIKLGSSAELRFPTQDFWVADIIDYVDPENISFSRERRARRTAKTG